MASKKLPLWRRIRRRGYWLLLLIFLNLANFLPITTGRQWGVWLARFAVRVRHREKGFARDNIQLVFPAMDKEQRERLLAESVDALGANFFDILVSGKLVSSNHWVKDEVKDEACPRSGVLTLVEELAALKNKGRGVLILSGHLGAWELSGGTLARLWQEEFSSPLDLSVVTGTVHNPAVNRLVQERRAKLGVKILPRDHGVRPLLAALDRGAVVAVLMDQNAGVQNMPVPLFGQDAPTASGFARIALLKGCPVLPVVMARKGRGHIIRHLPALDPDDFRGPNAEMGAAQQIEFLSACNRQLETFILRNPVEWVWFHNRWGLGGTGESHPSEDNKENRH